MGGHLADDTRIVADAGSAGIGGPDVGLGGSPGCEIAGDEGMQAIGRIIGHFGETNAAGAGTAVLDLDGADDQHFTLMAASAAAGHGIMLAADASRCARSPTTHATPTIRPTASRSRR